MIFRSLTDGIYEDMIHNMVSYSSGYLQIHKKGYWDEQSIDNSLEEDDQLYQELLKNPEVMDIMPCLKTFAQASYFEKIKDVLVLVIDSVKEKMVNNLHKKIVEGAYIETITDPGVVFNSRFSISIKT